METRRSGFLWRRQIGAAAPLSTPWTGDGRSVRLTVADDGVGVASSTDARAADDATNRDAGTNGIGGADGFSTTTGGLAAARGEGFGLLGVRERAQLLGGRVRVRAAAGRGFTLELELPL